jgi:hypothetical protein
MSPGRVYPPAGGGGSGRWCGGGRRVGQASRIMTSVP